MREGLLRTCESGYGQLEQPEQPEQLEHPHPPQKKGKEKQPVWHESINTRAVRHAQFVIDDTPSHTHCEQLLHQLRAQGS